MDPNPRRATKKWVGALRDLRSIRPACLRPRSRLRAESRRASAPRARDAAQRLGGIGFLLRQIAQRHDADELLVTVHDRQAPHLDLRHVLARIPYSVAV